MSVQDVQPASIPPPAERGWLDNPWVQLSAGILGMVAVANFQYSWTLFVGPLEQRHGWSRVSILSALTLFFTLAQTWLVPLEGFLAERFGPRRLLVAGGLMAGLAWVVNSRTDSLMVLYAAQVVAGCGSGIVYGISMGSALKWFPQRRGLAAGLTAAAFGAGSALTILPIQWTIEHAGYEAAFLWFGIGQGLVVVLAGLMMRFPHSGEVPVVAAPRVLQSTRDYTPVETLRSPAFWLLYAMMTLGAIPGLLMVGQLAPMAKDFGFVWDIMEDGVKKTMQTPITVLGITVGALSLALIIDRGMGGLTRPVFGWLSDNIGRELAIFLAFGLEGAALFVLIQNRDNAMIFVLMSGLAFFGWGAVFSLFPAVSGDMFGRKYATTNYGLLYTAKGAATILIDVCNRLQAATGSWELVFAIMIAADWLAALAALFVLRPLRVKLHAAATMNDAETAREIPGSEPFPHPNQHLPAGENLPTMEANSEK
jgi:OFA family oxalate/formate antiporter-like MFS transporter